MARGALIAVEGLDRAGKSTQVAALCRHLNETGLKTVDIRFPDRTTAIGSLINQYLSSKLQLDDHAIHLLFSANRWETVDRIKGEIAAGSNVIIDRYYFSGCVYSAAKDIPDVCLFLSLSVAEAAKRGGYGEEKYETTAMQDRVRQLFEELRNTYDKDDIVVINADHTPEVVEAHMLEEVQKTLKKVKDGLLGEHVRELLPPETP